MERSVLHSSSVHIRPVLYTRGSRVPEPDSTYVPATSRRVPLRSSMAFSYPFARVAKPEPGEVTRPC
jgi:hypothetical protein